jgi:hypothetical protein
MKSEITLFVFPLQDVLDRLCPALLAEGYRSIVARTPEEARGHMENLPFLPPDLVVTHAGLMPAVRRVTDALAPERTPFVLLTDEDVQSHAGVITDDDVVGHVAPPYDAEALLQCMSVAFFPAQRGSFPTISPFVLLQTLTAERKTGTAVFTRGAECITVRFRDGRVIGARGVSGTPKEVLFYLLTWSDGRFRVVLEPVSEPDEIGESTESLFLAGMRQIKAAGR